MNKKSLFLGFFWVCGVFAIRAAVADIPRAYHTIANDYQIPVDVFFSVMLQESGKQSGKQANARFLPWPWVLNVELKPYFFETKAEAEIALKQFLAVNPKAQIDVGLGQINIPAHGDRFRDKTTLLDPGTNLNYAARILATEFQWTLKQSQPNWWLAVGRYHAPNNPRLAKKYREGVFKRCQLISQSCTNYGAI